MGEKTNLKMLLVIAVILFLFGCATALADVFHVDADASPGGDGDSWATAFKYLQDALNDAESGDEIWVAEGTYKPDRDEGGNVIPGNRYEKFQLINGVGVYGGYAGYGAPDPDARDVALYETILSGDLNGGWGGNSYHVFYHPEGINLDATAILDGFTITAGNAIGFSDLPNWGGGMYNESSSPTITNCTFSGNSAGGMNGGGGGMYNKFSTPTLINCTFSGNSSWGKYNRGGGMYNKNSSPTLINCTFSNNSAQAHLYGGGGGMSNAGSGSNPTLTNCTFSGNSANHGGGMYNESSSPTITNCSFRENSVNYAGGGMRNEDSDPIVTNCTFSGNSAFVGGGMRNEYYSSPTVTNCILWGNTAFAGPQINNDGTSSVTVSYSDVQGGWLGTSNIDADPLFIGPGDLRLLPTSPCIDAGDNTAVPPDTLDLDGDGDIVEPTPWDLDGRLRFIDDPCTADSGNGTAPIVDMGAYEANYIEVAVKCTPLALNLGSQGKWLKAHFVLPEGSSPNDVDTNTPAVVALFGVESDYMNIFINEDGLVEIEACFSRSDFCRSAISDDDTEVIVIGLLNDGRNFYGTDTIKVMDRSLEYLTTFVSDWLETNCNSPDWCIGLDVNQDSIIDFIDFAMFETCCIEVPEDR
jgi:hypothetical protein